MGFLTDLLRPKNSISGQEVKELANDKNTVIIDVRTREEYSAYHVPKSINIPVEVISADKVKKYKDKLIIVYCQSGSRAGMASRILERAGFEVRNMGGVNQYPR